MAQLRRALGFWTILALSISSIMGTGLFFGVSAASSYSGNSSILAWVILSLIALYLSVFFAELSSMYPRAGGFYEFGKHAYGSFLSFMIGWIAWLVGNLTNALVVVAAMDYLIQDPSKYILKIGISLAIIIILNFVAFFGVKSSAYILVAFAVASIAVLVTLIIPGMLNISIENYSPFFPIQAAPILVSIFFIAESFFGWESVTYMAEETQEPEKSIPKAMIIGTAVIGLLSILIAVISLGIIPWKILASSKVPLSLVSEHILGGVGMEIMKIGIVIVLIGSAASSIISLPRLILALARDKLFISQLSEIHEKYKTPHKAIFFQTLVSIGVFALAFGKYSILLRLLLPLGLVMYLLMIAAVIILRKKEPHMARGYRVPFARTGGLLLISFILGIIYMWLLYDPNAMGTIQIGLSLIFVGIPIYFLLGIYHNPDTIIKINDALAYFNLFTERIILPVSIRKEILQLLGDIRGKKVLEFGCSVGTLTIHLAEAVKPHGRVYATDLSKIEILITKRRLEKKGHSHVSVFHDEHQINRVHPEIPNVDAVVSIGMMGYLQDVKKVLREVRDLLPYGGKVVFVDYADFFHVIPNVNWLSTDRTVEKVFREAGFSVFVTRKKGFFWNYVYVYGIKFHEDVPYI